MKIVILSESFLPETVTTLELLVDKWHRQYRTLCKERIEVYGVDYDGTIFGRDEELNSLNISINEIEVILCPLSTVLERYRRIE